MIPVASPQEQEANGNIHILLVEDDAILRDVCFQALSLAGYRVLTAEDGLVAWDLLQANSFDLIFTDNNMPQMTGVELIERVRKAGMTLPVILASGVQSEADLDSREVFFLAKPVTFQMVLEKVKEILPSGSGSSHRN
jgi:DNA-binding response OmpR family regulator